nr:anion permease [Succinivibrionaceae bacterium]
MAVSELSVSNEGTRAQRQQVRKKALTLAVVALVCTLAWFVPLLLPSLEFTSTQRILLVIFVGAALCWITEPIPAYATSVLIIACLAFLLSDSAFGGIHDYIMETDKEHVLKYKSVLHSFAAPVLILFLGGFSLAIGASNYKLDLNLARILLKPFGTQPKYVMLGMMSVTALFSMFMSNTATTVMML